MYYCAINGKAVDIDGPKEVVLRLHGSELMGYGESVIKTIGVAAESVVQHILISKGMAPKTYSIFNEGRIEEYLNVSPILVIVNLYFVVLIYSCCNFANLLYLNNRTFTI